MSGTRIFYVYFHDTDFVPIHVAEVVNEMVSQGLEVHLFAYRNVREKLADALATGRLHIHVLWAPRMRFVAEVFFVTLLLPVLLWQVVWRRPAALYVRHSAVSLAAALASRLTGVPCLIEVNDIPFDKLQNASRLKLAWVQLYHRLSLPYVRWNLPVTRQIADWLGTRYRISPRRIRVIPNGVNIDRFSPRDIREARSKYGIAPDAEVVVCLGSLFPWAGIETLIAATPAIREQHPNLLVAIGSGEEPYLSQIKALVQRQGLDGCYSFFGFIPWQDAAWFISCADLCAAPFILRNTRSGLCSLRVLSYLACGRPVVGSDIAGLGDILDEQQIGMSFKMGDSAALGQRVNTMLADPRELAAMGSRGREYVVARHGWKSIISEITACIRQGRG
jgi:glycosyltransferase involved in cell wall biosynthesis